MSMNIFSALHGGRSAGICVLENRQTNCSDGDVFSKGYRAKAQLNRAGVPTSSGSWCLRPCKRRPLLCNMKRESKRADALHPGCAPPVSANPHKGFPHPHGRRGWGTELSTSRAKRGGTSSRPWFDLAFRFAFTLPGKRVQLLCAFQPALLQN